MYCNIQDIEEEPAVVAWIVRASMYHSVYIPLGDRWFESGLKHGRIYMVAKIINYYAPATIVVPLPKEYRIDCLWSEMTCC